MIQHHVWKEIDTLQREMDAILNGLTASTPVRSARSPFVGASAGRYPALRLREDEAALYVEAVLPGVDPESLDLAVERHVLTLSGEKPQAENGHSPEVFYRKERAAGTFTRRVILPAEIDVDRISASYTHGILIVTLPKVEKAEPKQIRVKAA